MSDTVAFIVYVSDPQAAARFYGDLLGREPSFTSPRYVTFDVAPGAQLAVWGSDEARDALAKVGARTNEVCLCLPGGPEVIDQRFEQWAAKGVTVVQEPHDAPFGRTFLVADPDGNLIRVAPVD